MRVRGQFCVVQVRSQVQGRYRGGPEIANPSV